MEKNPGNLYVTKYNLGVAFDNVQLLKGMLLVFLKYVDAPPPLVGGYISKTPKRSCRFLVLNTLQQVTLNDNLDFLQHFLWQTPVRGDHLELTHAVADDLKTKTKTSTLDNK